MANVIIRCMLVFRLPLPVYHEMKEWGFLILDCDLFTRNLGKRKFGINKILQKHGIISQL